MLGKQGLKKTKKRKKKRELVMRRMKEEIVGLKEKLQKEMAY